MHQQARTSNTYNPVGGPPPTQDRPSLDQLGNEIAELSAHIHAATFRLLTLIREFDERDGWATGFCSCAHWLNWRTGLGKGAAREKVRVARALGELPVIGESMRKGELSYSKVRALTRVATPENEQELLNFAQAGTASHVETLVRAWRKVDRQEELEEADKRHQHRYVRAYTDEDGMLVLRARLEPEVGAVVMRALEAAADVLYREPEDGEETGDKEVSGEQKRADALGLVAESALKGELDSGSRGDRYQVVVHVDAEALKDPDQPGQSVLEDGIRGRVAPGSCPPGAPTDPDVRDSRIRLLDLRFGCAAVDTVYDAWGRQGVVAQQARWKCSQFILVACERRCSHLRQWRSTIWWKRPSARALPVTP